MEMLKYVLIGVVAPIIGFIIWRFASVGRGARQRDERLARELDPLANRLEQRAVVDKNEVLAFARKPQFRHMLYALLKHFNRTG